MPRIPRNGHGKMHRGNPPRKFSAEGEIAEGRRIIGEEPQGEIPWGILIMLGLLFVVLVVVILGGIVWPPYL